MTRTLPKDDSGTDYIQFRGYQSSVTIDDFGIRFTTGRRHTPDGHADVLTHEPLPVADREDLLDPDSDTPDNAIPTEIADAITNGEFANPLVSWGVVCEWPATDDEGEPTGEVCGETFDSPRSLNGHMRVHYDVPVDDEDGESDAVLADESAESTDTPEDTDSDTETEQ